MVAVKATLTCPHCGATEAKVTVESVATVSYLARVQAKIDIAGELVVKGKENVVVDRRYSGNVRQLATFRRDGEETDRIEILDWDSLELDDDDLVAFCWQCQGDVTDAFRALLNERVPLEPLEPTDNEIYNRPGVEGGIGYPLTAEAFGEHDWRL